MEQIQRLELGEQYSLRTYRTTASILIVCIIDTVLESSGGVSQSSCILNHAILLETDEAISGVCRFHSATITDTTSISTATTTGSDGPMESTRCVSDSGVDDIPSRSSPLCKL